MQSFSDLNNYANTSVSYNTADDYVIEFSTTAANLTTTEYEASLFNAVKKQELVTLINPSTDVLITFTLSNTASVSNVVNISAGNTISVIKTDDSEYTITGVRSIEAYDAVFSGVFLQTRPDVLTGFDLTVLADDQRGNTRTWTQTVTVIENNLLSYPNEFYAAEDQLLSLGNIQITDTYGAPTDYSLLLTVEDIAKGELYEFGNTTNELNTTDSKTNINSLLSNPGFGFLPASDFSGETSINLRLTRLADNRSTTIINIPIYVSEEPEYFLQDPTYYQINTTTTLNWQVLDQDITANSYTASFSQVSGTTGTFFVNGIQQIGNTVTFTGNVANVNSNIVAFRPNGNTFGNIGLVYNQSKDISGNVVVQANNVPVTMIAAIQDLSVSRTYNTQYYKEVFSDITINAAYGSSLQIGLGTNLSTQGVFANTDEEAKSLFENGSPFIYQWAAQGNYLEVQTALRAARFYPKPGYTGNVTVNMLIRAPIAIGDDAVIPLTLTPNIGGFPDTTVTITNSGTYTPTWAQASYAKADILMIGGGGGGAYFIGAAGGGGWMREQSNVTLSSQSYAVTVGSAGTGGNVNSYSGTAGGTTSGFGYTAPGGGAGTLSITSRYNPATGQVGTYYSATSGGSGYANNTSTISRAGVTTEAFASQFTAGRGGSSPSAQGTATVGGAARTSTITSLSYSAGGTGGNQPGTQPVAATGNGGSNGASRNVSPGANGTKGIIVIKWHN